MRPMTTGAGAGGGHLLEKQSLVPAVQELWNEWEIHFMILLSLSLQVFLFLFAGMRRHCSNWFLRTVLWLAYLSADSVAIFVLGHLAVRAREPGHELMAFWAPFVLVHLGGQDTITAFSKQDNELWRRHLLNLVLQAGVAGYVVAKASWPDARLRKAMVLMFVSGFFKYTARTGCLCYSDTENLKLINKYRLRSLIKGTAQHYERKLGVLLRESGVSVEQNVRLAKLTLDDMKKGSSADPPHVLFREAYSIIQDLIAMDAPSNKAHNIAAATHGHLQGLLERFRCSGKSRHNAYEYVGAILESCYRHIYTKEPARFIVPFTYFFNPLTAAIVTSIALALFRAAVGKAGDQLHTASSSSRVDITVTYVLLVGAIALDVSSATTFIFRHLSFFRLPCLPNCMKRQWSQKLGQYNIISTASMFIIWRWLACDVHSKPVTRDHTSIKKFILDTLLASGTRKEWNIASTHGMLALWNWMNCHRQDGVATTTLKSLDEEIIRSSADFPMRMLVLHMATDICYHYGDGDGDGGTNCDHQAVKKHRQTSTELSNYIMYLVFKRGVMLTTNSKIAHDNAREEIDKYLSQPRKIYKVSKCCKDLLANSFSPFKKKVDRAAVMRRLIEAVKEPQQQDSMDGEINTRHQESEEQQDPTIEIKNQESEEQQDSTIEIERKESTDVDDDNAADDDQIKKLKMNSKFLKSKVLPRAVAVAQELISINDEAERWELIAKVWAEMLYYIAPRCGGDFHYECLSTGGEFVTHVLFLMYYLGPFLP